MLKLLSYIACSQAIPKTAATYSAIMWKQTAAINPAIVNVDDGARWNDVTFPAIVSDLIFIKGMI